MPLPTPAPAGQTPTPAPAGQDQTEWDDIVGSIATANGVNPALAKAVAKKESWFNPNAVGDNGKAVGMFQLHEGAAADTGVDRTDPIQNISGGVKYLKQLTDRYNGDLTKTLQAYNGGSKYVDAGQVSPAAQAYASNVLADLSAGMRPATGGASPVLDRYGKPLPPPSSSGGRGTGVQNASGFADFISGLGETLDPRTQPGRLNIAATAVGIGTGIATGGVTLESAALTKMIQVFGPIMAATLTGAGETAVEKAAGTEGSAQLSPTWEGAKQGMYEAGGQIVALPFRMAGRRLIAPSVANTAADKLKDIEITNRAKGHAAVDTAREKMADTLRTLREAHHAKVDTITADATVATRATKAVGAQRLADTELQNAADLAGAERLMDDLSQQATGVRETASAVKATLDGPTYRALRSLGEGVRQAAVKGKEAGVTVDFPAVQSSLREMAEKIRPGIIFGQTEEKPGAGFLTGAIRANTPGRAGAAASSEMNASLRAAIAKAAGVGVEDVNPELPGILGKIMNVQGPVDLEQAHMLKMELDGAINWGKDRVAKTSIGKLTKGVRGALREAMTGYEPYDNATAAYSNVVQLHRKGIGKKLIALSDTPEGLGKIVTLLKDRNPLSVDTLRNLLVTQAEAGGDRALGQRAWDAVRSRYVHEEIVGDGIKSLQKNLDEMATQNPEFLRAMFGDEAGITVMSNLSKIADAYTLATEGAARRTAATTAQTAANVEGVQATRDADLLAARRKHTAASDVARRAGRRDILLQKRLIETTKEQHAARVGEFKASSMGNFRGRSIADVGADIVRAGSLGLGSIWGAQSTLRVMLQGPRGSELLYWAALSPRNTRLLVSALTKPGPPQVVAGLLRMAGTAIDPPPSYAAAPTQNPLSTTPAP